MSTGADGQQLRAWYEQGKTLREVAALGGVSHETARTRILAAGGTLRRPAAAPGSRTRPRHARRPSDADLLAMYPGKSSEQIARELQVGAGTVRRWLKEAGAIMARAGRKPTPPPAKMQSICKGTDCPGLDLVSAPEIAGRLAELGDPVTVDAVHWWAQATRRQALSVAYPAACPASEYGRRHWADVLAWRILTGKLEPWTQRASIRRWGNPWDTP